MTDDVLDPGKAARRAARKQQKLLEQQQQKQRLKKAEAEGELELIKSRATNPMSGRRSLIAGVQKREGLG